MTNTSNVSNVTNDKNIDRSNKNGQGISNDTFTRLVNRDEQSRNDIRNMVNSQTSVPGVAGFRRTRKCEDDEEGGESTVLDGEVLSAGHVDDKSGSVSSPSDSMVAVVVN